jgi:hypothetical protein
MNLHEEQQERKIDSDAIIPIICALLPTWEEDDEELIIRARSIYDAYLNNYYDM